MPKNKVQFKRGMSSREFMSKYGTREHCEQALGAGREVSFARTVATPATAPSTAAGCSSVAIAGGRPR